LDERISLAKAAELLGLTRLELEREFRKRSIPIKSISVDDVKAEIHAIQQW
jgi:predicted HTH domain antitoxin